MHICLSLAPQDMRRQMEYWNRPDADKFSRVQEKLSALQDTMKNNIEMVLVRGEQVRAGVHAALLRLLRVCAGRGRFF